MLKTQFYLSTCLKFRSHLVVSIMLSLLFIEIGLLQQVKAQAGSGNVKKIPLSINTNDPVNSMSGVIVPGQVGLMNTGKVTVNIHHSCFASSSMSASSFISPNSLFILALTLTKGSTDYTYYLAYPALAATKFAPQIYSAAPGGNPPLPSFPNDTMFNATDKLEAYRSVLFDTRLKAIIGDKLNNGANSSNEYYRLKTGAPDPTSGLPTFDPLNLPTAVTSSIDSATLSGNSLKLVLKDLIPTAVTSTFKQTDSIKVKKVLLYQIKHFFYQSWNTSDNAQNGLPTNPAAYPACVNPLKFHPYFRNCVNFDALKVNESSASGILVISYDSFKSLNGDLIEISISVAGTQRYTGTPPNVVLEPEGARDFCRDYYSGGVPVK